MLRWQIDVMEDGARAGEFEIPGTVEKPEVVELLRLLTAKSLTFGEIVGCVWSKHHGRLELLDVQEQDEGRTLTCGHGLVVVTARYMVRPQ